MRDVSGWPVMQQIEYFAARNVWPRRRLMTPSGACTWSEWFERKFGRSLDLAAEDFRRERDAARDSSG